MLPDALPAEVGEKETVTVVCWPGLRLRGSETGLTLNCVPVRAACVTVRVSMPVFVTIMACESVLPTTTDVKLMEGGVNDIVAEPGEVEVPGLEVMPAQPTCMMIPSVSAMIASDDVLVVAVVCDNPRRLDPIVSFPRQSMYIAQSCHRLFDREDWSSVQITDRCAHLAARTILFPI
jgi:hypothetical protein